MGELSIFPKKRGPARFLNRRAVLLRELKGRPYSKRVPAVFEPARSVTAFGGRRGPFNRGGGGGPSSCIIALHHIRIPASITCCAESPVACGEAIPFTCAVARGMHACEYHKVRLPAFILPQISIRFAGKRACQVLWGTGIAMKFSIIALILLCLSSPCIHGMSAIKGVWLPIQAVSGYPHWNDFPSSEASAAAQALM